MTDYFDTSGYANVGGWDYYTAQDISPDDLYYSPPATASSDPSQGFISGFSKIGDAISGLIGKTGGYFDQWVDYQMQDSVFGPDYVPAWAVQNQPAQQPTVIQSGIDQKTLLIGGGVALAFIAILAISK